jgi:GTP-binding protein EngB required for normal cell division
MVLQRPGEMRRRWGTDRGLLQRRQSLRGVIVVMDEASLKDHDSDVLRLAQSWSVPVHILLTKADKSAAMQRINRWPTSARSGAGPGAVVLVAVRGWRFSARGRRADVDRKLEKKPRLDQDQP